MVARVRGVLFVDYVRMVRGQKRVDWKKHLKDEDLSIISQNIDPDGWYPMATFERLGLAILAEIGHGQLEGVRMWGRFQVEPVRKHFRDLVAPNDPRDTMMRFDVLAECFFDGEALRVDTVEDDHASVVVAYGMSPKAEETASHQSLGFFERLVEVAGGKNVEATFKKRSWAGDDKTLIELHWELK